MNTPVLLDPNVAPPSENCDEEECIRLAELEYVQAADEMDEAIGRIPRR